MEQVAFELEFLVVVHCVQNVSSNLKQIGDYFSIWVPLWGFVDWLKNVAVFPVGFLLKSVILVDLIRFQLQKPAHGFGLNVELLVWLKAERVCSIRKYFIIIDILEMFAEEELGRFWIFFGLDVIKFEA